MLRFEFRIIFLKQLLRSLGRPTSERHIQKVDGVQEIELSFRLHRFSPGVW